uniref:Uncharacterized protein n=1 Tax=Acanthochromis polyacanthus TaxID=80966 RepID=A0A3Q1GPC7_9TELE
MAEDHGLCYGKAPIQITERRELCLLVLTGHIELFNVVQRLLFPLQLDDIGVRNHSLRKPPHRVLKGCREKEHLTVLCQLSASALVLMTLRGNHHISLVQHKHSNLLGVNVLVLGAPVKYYNCGHLLTSVPTNGVLHFHIWTKLPHLLNYFANLQCKLVRRRDTKTLKETVLNGEYISGSD